jgi:CSLREA domain-containing protein
MDKHNPKPEIRNLDSEPAAVLPVQLNADGLTDLVVLKAGSSAPTVILTPATNTLIVNSNADPGDGVCDATECTLREAITAANARPGLDLIAFNIPGIGPHSIQVQSALPVITDPVVLDGTTQPGFSGRPLIELDGSQAGAAYALTILAGNSTVRGLVINRFSGDGIRLVSGAGNVIEGNSIGTDVTGTLALGNAGNGVRIVDSPKNVIGGTNPESRIPHLASRNLISGNTGSGVFIQGERATGNLVQGNFIGTERGGRSPLGNGKHGVLIAAGAHTIGGTAKGAENTIAFNGSGGIVVVEGAGNAFLSNSIFGNTGLGLDLGNDGKTLNDDEDRDTGPNNLQNAPEMSSLTVEDGQTIVTGNLRSKPNTAFRLEFFLTDAGQGLDPREGERFIGATMVRTDERGTVAFKFNFPEQLASGQVVTATATDPNFNTSEFSLFAAMPGDCVWNNAAGGNWGTASNWDSCGGGVPGMSDNALITLDGTYTVTLNVTATILGLTLGGSNGTQTLSISANTLTLNDTSTVNANGILSQSGGTLTGSGNLTVSGTMNWSGGTVSGSGSFTVSSPLNLSGTIIVEKQTNPDGATGNFTFTGSAAGMVSDNGQIVVNNLVPGQYTSTENDPTPMFDLTSIACDDANSTGNVGTRTATFNLEAGETVKCTFTNTKRGTIIVNKTAIGGDDTFSFTTTGGGGLPAGFDVTTMSGNGSQTFNNIVPGNFSVSEQALAGWSLTNSNCSAGTPAGFTLAPGATVTCTFTNTKGSSITIIKDAVPNDPQDFQFSRSFWADFFLDDDGNGALPNTTTFPNLAPGGYTVTELGPPAGWILTNLVCVDPDSGSTVNLGTRTATIDLDAGETVTCTFTDTKLGTITIIKDAVPNDAQDFAFSGTLGGFSLDDDADGTLPNTRTFTNLNPGSFTVTEAAVAGWNLTNLVCVDPDSGSRTSLGTRTATIDLDPGETITCTFTNSKVTANGTTIQDERNGNCLLLNLTTGDYSFKTPRNGTYTGQVVFTQTGNNLVFRSKNGEANRLEGSLETRRRTAKVTLRAQGRTYTITDLNIDNNTACQ